MIHISPDIIDDLECQNPTHDKSHTYMVIIGPIYASDARVCSVEIECVGDGRRKAIDAHMCENDKSRQGTRETNNFE